MEIIGSFIVILIGLFIIGAILGMCFSALKAGMENSGCIMSFIIIFIIGFFIYAIKEGAS